MKKLIVYIMCLFACAFAHADDTVYITNLTAGAGNEVTLSIRLRNAQPTCGIQFDIVLPEGVSAVTDANGQCTASLASRTTAQKHTLMCAPQKDGTVRVLCYSLTNAAFSLTDGEVLNLKLKVASTVSSGVRSITLRNIILSSPTAPVTYVSQPSTGKITITASSVLSGDVDRNGKVDVNDVKIIIDYCLGRPISIDTNAADVNGDKKVTIADAVKIIQSFKK